MARPPKVQPLRPAPSRPDIGETPAPTILGKLAKDDFELWVCLSPGGHLFLKWWRWREDIERFQPLEDGALTLDPDELKPLAELLASVSEFLARRET